MYSDGLISEKNMIIFLGFFLKILFLMEVTIYCIITINADLWIVFQCQEGV